MKNILNFCLLCCFLAISLPQVLAQKTYTDHKPKYRPWKDDYILDKIEYTKSSTIFHFRFVCENSEYTQATFYPPGGAYPWYLRGKNVRKDYELKAIKNVRRNGKLMAREVKRELTLNALTGRGYTVFSCEVHFPRLPNDVKTVDLIEGRGKENNSNHFNCFDVKLKTWDDDDLGDEDDSDDNVRQFEERFGVETDPPPPPPPPAPPKEDPPKEDPPKEDPPKEEPQPTPPPTEDPEPTPPPPPPPAPSPYGDMRTVHSIEDIVCGEKLVMDKIKFKDNSTEITGMVQARAEMNLIRQYMMDNPESKITLYGHSDIFGNAERNKELSRKRVYKIQRWLSGLGVAPGRIDLEWYGGEQPIFPEGNPLNRRVEIKMDCN